MSYADGKGLGGFSVLACGPGFSFVQLLFLLIKKFLDAPTEAEAFIEDAGGERHLICKRYENIFAVRAAGCDSSPSPARILERDCLVAEYKRIDVVGTVNLPSNRCLRRKILLPSGKDVDAFALFEVVGVLKINNGAIIDEEGRFALASTAPQSVADHSF